MIPDDGINRIYVAAAAVKKVTAEAGHFYRSLVGDITSLC